MTETNAATTSLIDHFFVRLFEFNVIHIIEYVGIALGVIAALEVAWDCITGKRRTVWEPLANFSFQLVTMALSRTFIGLVVIYGFALAEPYAFLEIPVTWWSWIACLIWADFTYYWMHRCEHRVRLFWALHSVHHSSEEYDLSTSLRIFWLIDCSIVFFYLPMIFLGFSAPQVLVCMVMVFTYMIWVHTEKIGSLGWLDKVVSTPSVHRVHHGSNPQYVDKNYAGILLVWDRIFGTYEPEVEKVRYGLTTPIDTSNPIKIGFHEIWSLWRDLKDRKNWRDRLATLMMPPGWTPRS